MKESGFVEAQASARRCLGEIASGDPTPLNCGEVTATACEVCPIERSARLLGGYPEI